jgi:hypothetical protein
LIRCFEWAALRAADSRTRSLASCRTRSLASRRTRRLASRPTRSLASRPTRSLASRRTRSLASRRRRHAGINILVNCVAAAAFMAIGEKLSAQNAIVPGERRLNLQFYPLVVGTDLGGHFVAVVLSQVRPSPYSVCLRSAAPPAPVELKLGLWDVNVTIQICSTPCVEGVIPSHPGDKCAPHFDDLAPRIIVRIDMCRRHILGPLAAPPLADLSCAAFTGEPEPQKHHDEPETSH